MWRMEIFEMRNSLLNREIEALGSDGLGRKREGREEGREQRRCEMKVMDVRFKTNTPRNRLHNIRSTPGTQVHPRPHMIFNICTIVDIETSKSTFEGRTTGELGSWRKAGTDGSA